MGRTLFATLIAFVSVVGSACVPAVADTTGCPPDAPSQVIKAAPSQPPDKYEALGRSNDEVVLAVALDKNSRILNISVEGTTEPLLNGPAIDAARASIFRTAVHDCKPVPATYRFVFAYSSP